jgi:hypothetical protein
MVFGCGCGCGKMCCDCLAEDCVVVSVGLRQKACVFLSGAVSRQVAQAGTGLCKQKLSEVVGRFYCKLTP